ncbi:MAG: hypothetical protein JXA78_01795 [Anaerolineales bacterium]|nr:hypothetical protein [Anaerolineales bacterium]
MLDNLPISAPDTPYDYVAFKEIYRQRLDRLDMATLAELYGLSSLERFADPDFRLQVEARLEAAPDPTRQRFEFAYHLASAFSELYGSWRSRRLPSEPHVYRYERIPADDPEYVGELPAWLVQNTMDWLLAGIAAYRADRELMQNVHWLKYRCDIGDTYLLEVMHSSQSLAM